ncbi:glycosyltransferase family 4 protein [Priestia megaterium]|uniref:glycosyltransferase family 4 protein n=1 Tax=Priestia megaterium TaxID=1404 RepID=UPI0023DB6614|nr:glycosyltransferase family 4 protein [Priestia megaterium]MDF2013707.1 glycosyltransferase family 4 protein [Priestia megaterium]
MVEKVKTDKKKLLIYAHYYIPDVASTGQILRELAEGMINEFDITIVCVVPSYTGKVADEYKKKMFYKEEINGVKVIRIRVPEFSKSNKISRIKNILSYFIGAMIATFKVGKIDYVYSISQPPILGGLLGVWGKWMKRAKYIYNIQDFNPEQTMAVGYSKNKLILKTMMWFDKFSCKQADKVIVVGRDMVETLKGRFNYKRVPSYAFINNWTNEKVIYPLPSNHKKVVAFKKNYGLEGKFVVMYSGNLGLYYDLENLMTVINKFKHRDDVAFAFIGEGSIKEKLVSYKEKHGLDNVKFIPYQDKADLIYSLNAGDVHWCLNAKGIKGVSVPSKLYGIIAAGKPIIGALEENSEARLIIEDTKCGYVTEPGNYEEIEHIINTFLNEKESHILAGMSERGRDYLVNNLTKDVSVQKYIAEIKSS